MKCIGCDVSVEFRDETLGAIEYFANRVFCCQECENGYIRNLITSEEKWCECLSRAIETQNDFCILLHLDVGKRILTKTMWISEAYKECLFRAIVEDEHCIKYLLRAMHVQVYRTYLHPLIFDPDVNAGWLLNDLHRKKLYRIVRSEQE